MDEMCISSSKEEKAKSPKIKFILIATIIAIFCLAGLGLYETYLSPEAKRQIAEKEKAEKAMQYVESVQQKLREDTYGGKTPEETIAMFADALEKGDVDLAIKYVYESEGSQSSIGRRGEFRNAILKAQEEGKILEIVNALRGMQKGEGGIDGISAFFEYKNQEKEFYISLIFNEFSGVWKIQSL
jgi:hypothetical protein